jgi:hypothetical protein
MGASVYCKIEYPDLLDGGDGARIEIGNLNYKTPTSVLICGLLKNIENKEESQMVKTTNEQKGYSDTESGLSAERRFDFALDQYTFKCRVAEHKALN